MRADPGSASVMLQLQRVNQRLGATLALQDVGFEVRRGERVALVGANGCGKTTLLRVIHGLLDGGGAPRRAEGGVRQAMLFQRPHMLRTSARNNIAIGLWLAGTPWAKARERAMQALARVGLTEIAARNARMLSGGQQQRLALARAWALQPDLLLLDEPTASLDPHAKLEVETLIESFARGEGGSGPMTVVFASHNLGQVKRLASRVLYLEAGRVLADLPVELFFQADVLASVCPSAHFFVKGELL